MKGSLATLCVESSTSRDTIRNLSVARFWLAVIDPARDGLDAEQDDFLGWVSLNANNEAWVSWITERWSKVEEDRPT